MIATLTHTNSRLKVVVHSRDGFTDAEVKKHEVACTMLENVVNSVEFRERLLAKKLVRTEGLTNLQIYQKIMSGAEDLSPEHDGEIDVHVVIYHKHNKVVGYTYPSTVKTWLNRKFFSKYDYSEVACNLFHEWLHKLGFGHVSATDYGSVPYALGYLVEEMIKELIAGAVFTDIDGVPPVEPPPIPLPQDPIPTVRCYRSWRTLWLKKVCYIVG